MGSTALDQKPSDDQPTIPPGYFSTLKFFVIQQGDYGYSRNPGSTDDLTEMLKARHELNVPIQRLVLNAIKRLRDWQIKLFPEDVARIGVDGMIMNVAKLESDENYTTEYTEDDSEYDSSDSKYDLQVNSRASYFTCA